MSHTVAVLDTQGNANKFSEAQWHIDDRGQLHVNKDDTQLASYHRDEWVSVIREAYGPLLLGSDESVRWHPSPLDIAKGSRIRIIREGYPDLIAIVDDGDSSDDRVTLEITASASCGHPNHGSDDHDCTPFRLPERKP